MDVSLRKERVGLVSTVSSHRLCQGPLPGAPARQSSDDAGDQLESARSDKRHDREEQGDRQGTQENVDPRQRPVGANLTGGGRGGVTDVHRMSPASALKRGSYRIPGPCKPVGKKE